MQRTEHMENEKKENRNRNIQKLIRLNEEENNLIFEKMKDLKIKNFNTYARKILINGSIYVIDTADIKNHTVALNKIGTNINQIAVRLHEKNYSENEINVIKNLLQELINGEKEIIKACRKINNSRYNNGSY